MIDNPEPDTIPGSTEIVPSAPAVLTAPVVDNQPKVAVESESSGSSDAIMLAGLVLPMGLLIVGLPIFGISMHIGSEQKENTLVTATSEIGQKFGTWSMENTESAAAMEGKELSYDQFTQKIHDGTERKDVVEESTIIYSAGDAGNYEICVIAATTGDNPEDIHIYSSETNMVADAKKCS